MVTNFGFSFQKEWQTEAKFEKGTIVKTIGY